MRNLYLLLVLLFSFSIHGKSSDSLFQKGLDEIMNEEFKTAQYDFLKDAQKQASFSSYYNLGVASGSIEEWSKAKWAFESALKYRPLNGDAQFNAKFATQKISENSTWTHPYPWIERVILGFGSTTWTISVVISSLFLGLLIYNIISKTKTKSNVRKWCLRLIAPTILLFGISFYGINSINQHYNVDRYGILKNPETQFHISPNGVEIQDEIDPALRLELIKYFKDSIWVQVKSQGDNYLWVERKDLYTY